ncbi:carboxymuconolactone decarboxylase family protein [Kitasatospora sp. LaBMicrA B282]|uniref:carboxymuconolactone decarboxylase family protein n=1 Tax=Kitasatospora sp. LaBMicrA B282 TaxID=3420949 RepID=UPI003D0C46A6
MIMTNEAVIDTAAAPAAPAHAPHAVVLPEAPARVNLARTAPALFRAVLGLDAAARQGLDPALVELVQIRASQLNGCAYCLHMHTGDARKAGESEERLHLVTVWREAAHFFSAAEQAALALTEALTLVARDGVPEEVYARAAEQFAEPELAQLIGLICTINTWNRIALVSGKVAGTDERRR